jgi:hypothetical protein
MLVVGEIQLPAQEQTQVAVGEMLAAAIPVARMDQEMPVKVGGSLETPIFLFR